MVKKEALGSEEDMERHRLDIAMEKKNLKQCDDEVSLEVVNIWSLLCFLSICSIQPFDLVDCY